MSPLEGKTTNCSKPKLHLKIAVFSRFSSDPYNDSGTIIGFLGMIDLT